MKKENSFYAVHLYTQVRLTVAGVQAASMKEAMGIADGAVDYHAVLSRRGLTIDLANEMCIKNIEFTENVTEYACVDRFDHKDASEYASTAWLDSDGEPLVNDCSPGELKASRFDLAIRFMSELQASVETLGSISEQYGLLTLLDMMYLQNAILQDSTIDYWPGISNAMSVAQSLPSGDTWKKFISTQENSVPE